jgi:hypothetical protein
MENLSFPNLILNEHTQISEILNNKKIIVYHSCSFKGNLFSRLAIKPNKNIHTGSLFQTLWRADYKVNDNEDYLVSYVYEIIIETNKIYPNLIKDEGYNVNQSEEDKYKKDWDILIYKNTGEGFVKDENLSIIILNKNIIKSAKLHSEWNSAKLRNYFLDKTF